MGRGMWRMLLVLVSGTAGCLSSDSELADRKFRCETSAHCGAGWQCDRSKRFCVPAYDGINGVFSDRLVLGFSGPIEKSERIPNVETVGRAVRDGIETYFAHVNRSGGINGRRLELKVGDDSYLPIATRDIVGKMLSGPDRQVFALVSVIGTDPSAEAMKIAIDQKALFYAPGTGAGEFEPETPQKYVFNYRARYAEEMTQISKYMLTRTDPIIGCGNLAYVTSHIGTTDGPGGEVELGPVGKGGFKGTALALREVCNIPEESMKFFTYPENSVEVAGTVGKILRWMAEPDRDKHKAANGTIPVALPMVPAFDSGTAIIVALTDELAAVTRKTRNEQACDDGKTPCIDPAFGVFSLEERERLSKSRVVFGASSNAGLALVGFLALQKPYQAKEGQGTVPRRYGAGLILASPVPPVTSGISGVQAYLEHLDAYAKEVPAEQRATLVPNPFSLEGYLSMVLFGEFLKIHGRDLTTTSFIDTLESKQAIETGVGPAYGFGEDSHQAVKKLWGLRLSDTLQPVDLGFLIND